jgi:hypothetical protein
MNEYDLDETNPEHVIWMLEEILKILKNRCRNIKV